MKSLFTISGFFLIFFLSGCEDTWNKQYADKPETVDQNVWDALQGEEDVSSFINYMKEYQLDTLFRSNDTYTLFIPDNKAVAKYKTTRELSNGLVQYHIVSNFLQSRALQGKRKIQTFSEKFALFDNTGSSPMYDESEVTYESPLYINGKYFIISDVVEPKASLYEYITENCPGLKTYIDERDSIIVDKEKSLPLGFNDQGDIIYDTVAIIYNEFEELYFPVREEFRSKTATLVFPRLESYNSALDVMAQRLGKSFADHKDIPEEWQQDILIPYLLYHGMFSNMVEPIEFIPKIPGDTVRLKNILGDSLNIFYRPKDKILCSNGYAYDYNEFSIPDSLFAGSSFLEGESLLETAGINKWDWYDFVNVTSSQPFSPQQIYVTTASEDTVIQVSFPKGYNKTFSVEFPSVPLFPGRYRFVVGTHMDIGGEYNIYVNDELVRNFNYYDYVRYRGILPSVTGQLKDRFIPVGRFNKFDFYVDNITTYGRVMIRFEYAGPGTYVPNNGLVLDNIEFIPEW